MPILPFDTEVFPASLDGGVPDADVASLFPEQQIQLPATTNPAGLWINFQNRVEVLLDAGMALHCPLPQSDPTPDTLGVIGSNDPAINKFNGKDGGVNLNQAPVNADVIQRMANSHYTFVMRGFGVRAGIQVPVPILKYVGNQIAVPGEIQWTSGNVIVANWSGIPIFYCEWELHYMVTGPLAPSTQAVVPFNPALKLRGDEGPDATVQFPQTQVDQLAVPPQQAAVAVAQQTVNIGVLNRGSP